jgi:hypothetical protein
VIRFSSEKNKNVHPSRFIDTFNAIIYVNELRDLKISGVSSLGPTTMLILL